MRAVNDDDLSRRELTAIIRRDPSLVGSLLKMANSSFYRVTPRPVESIDRAVVVLGSEGIRSLIAAAVMQPIFRMSGGQFPRFPEIVWEHALRSANAAVAHAAIVEKADPFAAELLTLVTGLADLVLFRAVLDQYASHPRQRHLSPEAGVIVSLLDSQSANVARRIGGSWELSEGILTALAEQVGAAEPATALGRSLRFGRIAGALAILQINHAIDEAMAKSSLPDAGLPPGQVERMWSRLTHEPAAPTAAGRKSTGGPPRGRPRASLSY
jgi:HD-like signal output (HDOD) protein